MKLRIFPALLLFWLLAAFAESRDSLEYYRYELSCAMNLQFSGDDFSTESEVEAAVNPYRLLNLGLSMRQQYRTSLSTCQFLFSPSWRFFINPVVLGAGPVGGYERIGIGGYAFANPCAGFKVDLLVRVVPRFFFRLRYQNLCSFEKESFSGHFLTSWENSFLVGMVISFGQVVIP